MRLAVVQMLPTGEHDEDLRRLTTLVDEALASGAEIVVLPDVPSLGAGDLPAALIAEDDAVTVLGPPDGEGRTHPTPRETALGRVVDLVGDESIDPALHADLRAVAPNALVMRPYAESPLQAEAILELAVGYSTSLAGLVLIPATTAKDAAGDTFGGSAIVQHGEILAEAIEDDEVLLAEVDPRVRLQEPPSPPPEPQMILRQRLAHHRGGKAPVDYLADLS